MNACQKFVLDEIFPAIKKALKEEDNDFVNKMIESKFSKFYCQNECGLVSNLVTERTIQYIIFKELCKKYKVIAEDNAYGTSQRIDLSIYKNRSNFEDLYGEIGIEIKQVKFYEDFELYSDSFNKLISDFEKVKGLENENRYILILGENKPMMFDLEEFNEYLLKKVDKRKFKKFSLTAVAHSCFRTLDIKRENSHYHMLLLEVIEYTG
jgi:hypothetical protein